MSNQRDLYDSLGGVAEIQKKRSLPKREDPCQEEVKMSCKKTCKHLPLAFIINRDEDIKQYLGIDGSTFH